PASSTSSRSTSAFRTMCGAGFKNVRLGAGWRRSADRTGLRANCLQTGNFTGNFAELGSNDAGVTQEIPEPQALLSGFPTEIIREISNDIRDFNGLNRESAIEEQRSSASAA